MSIKTILATAAIAALSFAGTASNAAVFTYNFTASGSDTSSTSSTSATAGAPVVTVTAASKDTGWGGTWSSNPKITLNGSNGLGVRNSSNDNSHTVDNSGNVDMLVFNFAAPVTFTSLNLGYISNDSDFKYWVGAAGSTAASLFGSNGSVGGTLNPGTWNTYNNRTLSGTGSVLVVAASGTDWNDDFFKIVSLSVTANSNIPGTPDAGSTVALLGLALAGLGFAKRRFGAY